MEFASPGLIGRAGFPCALLAATLLSGIPHAPAAEAESPETRLLEIRPIDPETARDVSYFNHIRPILLDHCVECHSSEEPESGFDASSVRRLYRPGKNAGPAIVPGKPGESALVDYVRGLIPPQMPKGGPPLTADQLHLIRQWIAAGAEDDTPNSSSPEPDRSAIGNYFRQFLDFAPATPEIKRWQETLRTSDNPTRQLEARRWLRIGQMPALEPPPPTGPHDSHPIDRFIHQSWRAAGLPEADNPPTLCNDSTFVRRVFLDLTGVVPKALETQSFLDSNAPDKREKLIDELLERRSDYATHWIPFWQEALGTGNVRSQGGVQTRGDHFNWLFNSLQANKPYDIFAAQLLDSSLPGSRPPESHSNNGTVFTSRYLLNNNRQQTLQTASDAGQVFLGTSMKCASCHSHFDNREWPQSRFLAFAGMLNPHDLELIRCQKESGVRVPAGYPFEISGMPTAFPPNESTRLRLLALLTTDPANPRFAPVIVNRLWKRLLGLGLVEPADDFRTDRPGSHPELLAWLADDFVRHGYDLKHTLRLILISRTYQHRYHPELADSWDVEEPDAPRWFRSPQLRRLTAEQIVDSIRLVGNQKLEAGRRLFVSKGSTPLPRALGRPSSRNEISTSRSDNRSVVQALQLLNGTEYHKLIYYSPLLDLFASESNPKTIVQGFYLAALGRNPTKQEIIAATGFITRGLSAVEPPALESLEEIWIDDEFPQGWAPQDEGTQTSWKWITAPDSPVFQGERAHTSGTQNRSLWRHSVSAFHNPPVIRPGEILFTHVHPAKDNPPARIMIQWTQGRTVYQAYWRDSPLPDPEEKSIRRIHFGPMPPPGRWTRLEMPVKRLGMQRGELLAWAYDSTGGMAAWDTTGIVRIPTQPHTTVFGDLLWSLLSTPEFQYVF